MRNFRLEIDHCNDFADLSELLEAISVEIRPFPNLGNTCASPSVTNITSEITRASAISHIRT